MATGTDLGLTTEGAHRGDRQHHLASAPSPIGRISLGSVGYGIAGLLVVTRAVAVTYWKLGRVEECWESPVRS